MRKSLPVADEDDEGHAITKLVRTRRRLGSVCTGEFIQEPVMRSGQALLAVESFGFSVTLSKAQRAGRMIKLGCRVMAFCRGDSRFTYCFFGP